MWPTARNANIYSELPFVIAFDSVTKWISLMSRLLSETRWFLINVLDAKTIALDRILPGNNRFGRFRNIVAKEHGQARQ